MFDTPLGKRVVDQLANGIANEVGYQTLTKLIRTQIAKDAELIKSGQVEDVVWHFFNSPATGKGGPNPAVQKALDDANIKYLKWDMEIPLMY